MNQIRMWVGIAVLVVFAVGAIIVSQMEPPTSEKPPTDQSTIRPATEEGRIDAWITANNLNEYGDPKDRAYAGGTPLFDERTGTRIDRYDYIVSQHPDRPWNE